MKKKIGIIILILILLLVGIGVYFLASSDTAEIRTVKSEAELLKLYNGQDDTTAKEVVTCVLGMPFSIFRGLTRSFSNGIRESYDYSSDLALDSVTIKGDTETSTSTNSSLLTPSIANGSSKDFSTTNIQVENVDEADIIKTDGDYIYSISGTNVIITDVKNPEEIKIAATITSNDSAPEDLILNKDQLVVILAKGTTYNGNTVVRIYDITSRERPALIKKFELNQPYYTSRCIGNELYVIAAGNLKKENGKIVRTYNEDGYQKEIALD